VRTAVLGLADEYREMVPRVLDHVGPGQVAGGERRPARPAQAGKDRLGQGLDADAAVDVVLDEVLRLVDG
jgi:hypothetical protein